MSKSELDQLCINTIRFLAVDAIEKANSGHPGLPMGAAPMGYVLWTRFMKHNPTHPGWFDRDRFVLSAGHGSMLLYALLYLCGYDLSLEDIQQFRQWGSRTPGHPERACNMGVEVTTGPLGQGFGNGVGMAIAEANLAARYNKPGHEVINHHTYALVSDGDLMEGVASEAASLAGHLRLGKLIYLYDNNHVTLSAGTPLSFSENVAHRFDAYGWHVEEVKDGNDIEDIAKALEKTKAETDKPSLIIVTTHIGYGAPNKQDTFEAHGSPLGPEETKLAKEHLGWPLEPAFYVPEDARQHFHQALARGKQIENDGQARFESYRHAFPELAQELDQMMTDVLPEGWNQDVPSFPPDEIGIATRVAGGKVLEALAKRVPGIIGGSADLNPSTFTMMKGLGDFESPSLSPTDKQGSVGGGWSYAGRNLAFGIREHAMGTIINGIAAHGGLIPFGATFLTFSDYMRPTIRLAALSDLHVIYVFTHDSIALGEDGPTHQPVEHLASLRAIPRLVTIRPADANETAVAWQVALERKAGPVALIMTRQNVPILDRSQYAGAEGLRQGAYILADPAEGEPEIILIASGSEVQLIVKAQQELAKQGRRARIVSMPSWELFAAQSQEYRDTVLPPRITKRLAVEAAIPLGWEKYVGSAGAVIGIDKFGASAPGSIVMQEYGFSVENVCQRALELINKKSHRKK
jgi:transketolase